MFLLLQLPLLLWHTVKEGTTCLLLIDTINYIAKGPYRISSLLLPHEQELVLCLHDLDFVFIVSLTTFNLSSFRVIICQIKTGTIPENILSNFYRSKNFTCAIRRFVKNSLVLWLSPRLCFCNSYYSYDPRNLELYDKRAWFDVAGGSICPSASWLTCLTNDDVSLNWLVIWKAHGDRKVICSVGLEKSPYCVRCSQSMETSPTARS